MALLLVRALFFVFVALVGVATLDCASSSDPGLSLWVWAHVPSLIASSILRVGVGRLGAAAGAWRVQKYDPFPPGVDPKDLPVYNPTNIGRWLVLHECDLIDRVPSNGPLALLHPEVCEAATKNAAWIRQAMARATWRELFSENHAAWPSRARKALGEWKV